jgi:valyl-tRNA synthetase
MPFVTETIWKEFNDNLLLIQKWPQKNQNSKPQPDFELIIKIIESIRHARSEHKIEPARKIKAVIYAGEKTELVKSQAHLIRGLKTGIESLEIKENGEKIEKAIYLAVGGIEVYLLGARDEVKERARLDKEIVNLKSLVKKMKEKLANEEFVAKAPPAVIEKERAKLAGWESELKKITDQLTNQ